MRGLGWLGLAPSASILIYSPDSWQFKLLTLNGYRILGPDGSTPFEFENVSEVIINPETGEAEEVVVYITGPPSHSNRS